MSGALLLFSTFISIAILFFGRQISGPIQSLIQPNSATRVTRTSLNSVEQLHGELLTVMRQYGINSTELGQGLQLALSAPASAPIWANALVNFHTPMGGTSDSQVKVTQLSPPGSEVNYVDGQIQTTVQLNGRSSTQLRTVRLRLGQSSTFSNALTGDNFTCLSCHTHVFGDVAEYSNHWSMVPYSKRWEVHGTWYTAKSDLPTYDGTQSIPNAGFPTYYRATVASPSSLLYTGDERPTIGGFTNPNFVPDYTGFMPTSVNPAPYTNPADITVQGFSSHYSGAKLPYNFRRQARMLPKFDPDSMLVLAQGSVTGGTVHSTPFGSSTLSNGPGTVNKIWNGNLILDGRTNPISIQGRVFVRGDLIILGKISGQGELYSGRNIYLTGDLTYVNPPTLFDRSPASNTAMDQVDSNAANLAAQMAANDRLALFAANNIIIGDPYSEASSFGSPSKLLSTAGAVYSHRNFLTAYNGQLALDTVNGYMLDAQITAGPTTNYLYPWSISGQYLPNTEVKPEPVLQYDGNGTLAPTDEAFFLDNTGYTPPGYYSDLFLPGNMTAGGMVSWITQANFLALTNDSTQAPEIATKEYKSLSFPLFAKFPYDASKWNPGFGAETGSQTEGALTTLDSLTSIITQYGNQPVANPLDVAAGSNVGNQLQDPALPGCLGVAAGSPVTLTQALHDYFCRFQQFAVLNGLVGYNKNTALPPPVPQPIISGISYFNYNPGVTLPTSPAPELGRVAQDFVTETTSQPAGNPVSAEVCSDYMVNNNVSGIPTCFYQNSTLNVPQGDPRFLFTDWLQLDTEFSATMGMSKAVAITRYWDSTKIRARNRVSQIDAFLFSNYFVFFNRNSDVDDELKINGGLATKDVIGRVNNHPGGPLAPTSTQFNMMNGPLCLAPAPPALFVNFALCQASNIAASEPAYPGSFSAPGINSSVALSIVLDPRAQFHSEAFYLIDTVQFDAGP